MTHAVLPHRSGGDGARSRILLPGDHAGRAVRAGIAGAVIGGRTKRSGVHSCLVGSSRVATAINSPPTLPRRGSSAFRHPDRDWGERCGRTRSAPTVTIVRRIAGLRVHQIRLVALARRRPSNTPYPGSPTIPDGRYDSTPRWYRRMPSLIDQDGLNAINRNK